MSFDVFWSFDLETTLKIILCQNKDNVSIIALINFVESNCHEKSYHLGQSYIKHHFKFKFVLLTVSQELNEKSSEIWVPNNVLLCVEFKMPSSTGKKNSLNNILLRSCPFSPNPPPRSHKRRLFRYFFKSLWIQTKYLYSDLVLPTIYNFFYKLFCSLFLALSIPPYVG